MTIVVPQELVACWQPVVDVEERLLWQEEECRKQWAETTRAFNVKSGDKK